MESEYESEYEIGVAVDPGLSPEVNTGGNIAIGSDTITISGGQDAYMEGLE